MLRKSILAVPTSGLAGIASATYSLGAVRGDKAAHDDQPRYALLLIPIVLLLHWFGSSRMDFPSGSFRYTSSPPVCIMRRGSELC
jgi:hypothetical protein